MRSAVLALVTLVRKFRFCIISFLSPFGMAFRGCVTVVPLVTEWNPGLGFGPFRLEKVTSINTVHRWIFKWKSLTIDFGQIFVRRGCNVNKDYFT